MSAAYSHTVRLLGKSAENCEAVRNLVGIESQTDHFPFGEARKQYNPKYLNELDSEMKNYQVSFKDSIVQTCSEIFAFLPNITAPISTSDF